MVEEMMTEEVEGTDLVAEVHGEDHIQDLAVETEEGQDQSHMKEEDPGVGVVGGDPEVEVGEGNPTAILGVIQGQGHMTEKEVEIETGHDHTAQPHDQQRMNIVALHHQMPRNLIIQHVNSILFSRTINIHLQTHNLSTIILSYRLDTFR